VSNGSSGPRAPQSLGKAGRSLWRSVTSDFDLDPAEVTALGQACRLLDLLARADVELIEADSLTVEGSTGQPRAHPLLEATNEMRRTLGELLSRLALPLPDEVEGRYRSPGQLRAAQARWRGQRDAG
jgi:phage terminase small subunit